MRKLNTADKRLLRNKFMVLKMLGNKCVCCGITEFWNLTVDHITPVYRNTNVDRKPVPGHYYDIIQGRVPLSDYQCLCFGCNTSKNTGSSCNIDHTLSIDSPIIYDRRVNKPKKIKKYIY